MQPSSIGISPDRVVDSVVRVIKDLIKSDGPRVFQGTWMAEEIVDADLSQVIIDGVLHRWIRKHDSVVLPAEGDQVTVMFAPGYPLTITGIIRGDVTLAGG